MVITNPVSRSELEEASNELYRLVFRRDFSNPGFGLLTFRQPITSHELRRFMVSLKESLAERFFRETGRHLVYRSLARFNQQLTTKFHLDGSPPEAYLMLGYEPSEVPSSLSFADCTRAAFDSDITPAQLLSDFNPMFGPHEDRLMPYVTRLEEFDPSRSQIVLVNNSSLPFVEGERNSLGVMHRATILHKMADRSRVINSTMLVPADDAHEQTMGVDTQRAFVETDEVAGIITPSGA
jgi:hypothetical protein